MTARNLRGPAMTPLHVRRAPSSCDARPACSLAPCFHLQLEADHLQQPHTDAACASHLGEVVCGFTTGHTARGQRSRHRPGHPTCPAQTTAGHATDTRPGIRLLLHTCVRPTKASTPARPTANRAVHGSRRPPLGSWPGAGTVTGRTRAPAPGRQRACWLQSIPSTRRVAGNAPAATRR